MDSNVKSFMTITYGFGAFTEEEMDKIDGAAREIVQIERRYYVEESLAEIPAYIFFFLGFVSGAIATGFFEAIGSDIYRNLKNKVKKILCRKKHRSIGFEMESNSTKIKISSDATDEDEVDEVFDTINIAKDLAIESLSKKETPKMTEIRLSFKDKDLRLDSGQYWDPPKNVFFYIYNNKKNKWELGGSWFIKDGKHFAVKYRNESES